MITENGSTYLKILPSFIPWLPDTSIRSRISVEASNSSDSIYVLPMLGKVGPPVNQQPADMSVPRICEDSGYEKKR